MKTSLAPFFSIVIPTLNRPLHLRRCLTSLSRQDFLKTSFEVILVDDGSVVSPVDIVRSFEDIISIHLAVQHNKGPGPTRNFGAQKARGRYLSFIDDDCSATTDWLSRLAAHCHANPHSAVGGKIVNALPENPYTSVIRLIEEYLYTYYNADPNQARFFGAANLTVPKSRFLSIGGFNTDMFAFSAEDRDFCDRWIQKGQQMIYAEDAVIYHYHAETLTSFCRRHFKDGRTACRLHALRPSTILHRNPRAQWSFYWNLLNSASKNNRSIRSVFLKLLLILSQFLVALGYSCEYIKPYPSSPTRTTLLSEGNKPREKES